MNEKTPTCQDACWEAAWYWVQKQHEAGLDDPQCNAGLREWLRAAPENRAAYDKAAKIWAVAGLVPPSAEADHTDPAS